MSPTIMRLLMMRQNLYLTTLPSGQKMFIYKMRPHSMNTGRPMNIPMRFRHTCYENWY